MQPCLPSRAALLEAINLHLGLLAWLLTRQFSQHLHNFELTLPQFVVLMVLSGHSEPCLMGQLAHRSCNILVVTLLPSAMKACSLLNNPCSRS